MGTNSLLILHAPEIQGRMRALIERVDSDESLRQLYLNDPATVIQKTVFPDQENIPKAEINRANRLLYALLSNERFVEWSRSYEEDLVTRAVQATSIEDPENALRAYLAILDRTALHQDLASAVAQFADPELIAAITWRPELPRVGNARLPISADVAVEIETFVYAVAAVAVFAVAVAAVFIGAVEPAGEVVSRIDVMAVANQLGESLTQRAGEIRESGVLMQFSQRNVGYTR
ncbi:hypothetical protein [Amycolatopsis sp. NPDC051716]|uniref:hypothetical protein n=1 Tax=Amycolatopsis sp. NPDC051716 TaxID=3155804 RepID=UPI0034409371